MNPFSANTARLRDRELVVMCDVVDLVTALNPGLIHRDPTWSALVHAVVNEAAARSWMQVAA